MKHSIIIRSLIFVVLLIVFLVAGMLNVYADDALETYDVSVAGDNSIQAVLTANEDDSSTYTLTVSGTGNMKDYASRAARRPLWYADYGPRITKVVIDSGIKHIGNYSFDGSSGSSLTSVTLPESLETIGNNAFSNTTILDITIPVNVEEIGDNAFAGCDAIVDILGNNTKLVINDTAWGKVGKTVKAFEDSYTALNWIDIISTELEIKPSFSYSDEDKTIVSGYLANGKSIVIPKNASAIGSNAFMDNDDIITINLSNVTEIQSKAFGNCTGLQSIIIPKSVTTIADDAFVGCSELKLLVNDNSYAKNFAIEHGFEYSILKPYRIEGVQESYDKEMLIGDSHKTDLSEIFEIGYDSGLHYQVKIDNTEYKDIEGAEYTFEAAELGESTLVFRALDKYDEPSDDTYTLNYTVVSNDAPILNPDKAEMNKIVLFGEQIDIDLTGVFSDADNDELHYKYIDTADYDGEEYDWSRSYGITVTEGHFTTPQSWNNYPAQIGNDHVFYVKAYDKWDEPSEDALKITLKMHSVELVVTKGDGVHSLDGVSFQFSRDEADSINQPSEIVDNSFYFDLEYVIQYPYGPDMPVYRGGYDYTYQISLEGCDNVSGEYTSNRSSLRGDNTIEVTLSNPTQAAKDAEDVAATIALIDAIGDVSLENEKAVTDAQAAYDALFDDLKSQITNYEVLKLSKLTLSALKAQKAAEEAQAKAEAAQQAAETAQTDAEVAKAAAEEAQRKAEEAKAKVEVLQAKLDAAQNKVSGLKLKSKARKITVTWKKNANAEGYQVQFKLKTAKKYKTLKTLTGNKVVSKKLKKGKKYQFRVAPYKTIDGKKIFGKWVTKTVKCK